MNHRARENQKKPRKLQSQCKLSLGQLREELNLQGISDSNYNRATIFDKITLDRSGFQNDTRSLRGKISLIKLGLFVRTSMKRKYGKWRQIDEPTFQCSYDGKTKLYFTCRKCHEELFFALLSFLPEIAFPFSFSSGCKFTKHLFWKKGERRTIALMMANLWVKAGLFF